MKRRSWFTALTLTVVPLAVFTAGPASYAAAPAHSATAGQRADASLSARHPELDGRRVKGLNEDAIYLIIDGTRHWIPNPATYNNLFRGWDGILTVVDTGSIDNGGQLSDGAFLGKAPDAPQVYLISNGHKRWITSPAAMDKYDFAWNKIASVSSVALAAIPNGASIS
ncbi:hypothetical protein CTZ27_28820 [Streptomyces griseocarneus]|nr:hypothetical protein CTZ27_28820 [Streptomyces griseocarneus]